MELKKIKPLFVGGAILSFAMIQSCDTPTEPAESKVGDKWTYLLTDFDTLGNIIDTSTVDFEATAINSNLAWAYIERVVYFNMPGLPCGTFRMREDGLHKYTCGSTHCVDNLFLKYPGAVGDFYTSHYASATTPGNIFIASTNDSITVPYGYFNELYKYNFNTGSHDIGNIWFSDSVWFVKYNKIDSLGSGLGTYIDYSYELVDYTSQ